MIKILRNYIEEAKYLINERVNLITTNSQGSNLDFSIRVDFVFDLNKKVKEKLFNGLADWIIDKEPNYPSFAECILWIKKQNSQYMISKKDEKEILMLLTYLPMSQQMNNVLYAKYLDQILTK